MNSEPFTTCPRLCELNDRDVNVMNDPSSDFVEKIVRQFANAPFTIYAMYDDESMFATELTPHGLITMYKHSAVVAASLPNQVLSVPIGGQIGDFNHRFILPHASVIAPVREFLLHHRTPEELGWERQRPDHPMYKLWPEEPSPRRIRLNAADIQALFITVAHDAEITVMRSRPHNKTFLERSDSFKAGELVAEIEEALLTGHLYGGDITIPLPEGQVIQGNHNGQFWLEPDFQSNTA